MAWTNLKDLFVTRNEWDSVSQSTVKAQGQITNAIIRPASDENGVVLEFYYNGVLNKLSVNKNFILYNYGTGQSRVKMTID